jgi:hypothetical protein
MWDIGTTEQTLWFIGKGVPALLRSEVRKTPFPEMIMALVIGKIARRIQLLQPRSAAATSGITERVCRSMGVGPHYPTRPVAVPERGCCTPHPHGEG